MGVALDITRGETLIGKRVPKMDAPEKASGKTRYIHDINLPGQLHAKILHAGNANVQVVGVHVNSNAEFQQMSDDTLLGRAPAAGAADAVKR